MVRKLPPLNALKAFEAAARLSSFSRAAGELNVTHAAISRHVRSLEEEFRTPLFERTGRGVELTEAGLSLAQSLTKSFDLIAAASSQFARPSRRRRRLVVTSDVSFAALWLALLRWHRTESQSGSDERNPVSSWMEECSGGSE